MKIDYIEEIKLNFGHSINSFDPRIGLLKGGPKGPYKDQDVKFREINYGIIGTADSIKECKRFIEILSDPIDPIEHSTYGKLGFPGLNIESPLRFSLNTQLDWIQRLDSQEIDTLDKITEEKSRIEYLINIFEQKMHLIVQAETKPDIVIISIPKELYKIFFKIGYSVEKIKFAKKTDNASLIKTEGTVDFHNIMKLIGMKYVIPTQIITPFSLSAFLEKIFSKKKILGEVKEDVVTFAWNFSVALYYKAFGSPWKLSTLDFNVCYIGISFFRDFAGSSTTLHAAIAQVFISTGENFILKGESFEWIKTPDSREPKLKEDYARKLLDYVLDFYFQMKKTFPNRIVIHKSSPFNEEEIQGFYSNNAKIKHIDMVSVRDHTPVRYYRDDLYPVLRGTIIYSDDPKEKAYLFTSGFVPALETYPGPRVPVPLEIKRFTFDSDLNKVASEILILSRLDWNNIKYYSHLPVTLLLSKRVGDIMGEARAKQIPLQTQYRYYM